MVYARDPVGTYPALFRGLSPLILKAFPAYFVDFLRLFCGPSQLILRTFHAYFVDFLRLF